MLLVLALLHEEILVVVAHDDDREVERWNRFARHQSPRPPRSKRNARCFFTSGHSGAMMLYITLSRTEPSRRGQWCRRMPSFFAPSASIARCERKLKLSVRRPTTLQPRLSNACVSSSNLHAEFT